MAEFPSASETAPASAMTREALLREYLAGADVACPQCGYNLRGCRIDRCPECSNVIEVGVVSAEQFGGVLGWVRMAFWVSGVAALIMVGYSVWGAIKSFEYYPSRSSFEENAYLAGTVVYGGALLAVLTFSVRYAIMLGRAGWTCRRPDRTRRAIQVLCGCLVTVSLLPIVWLVYSLLIYGF